MANTNILEVAIVGAGISGINSAYRVREAFPDVTYQIFEGRKELGGTWSFFKYPGPRSDSDLFSFGFEWNPWQSDSVIAEAADIMEYMNSTVRDFGILENIAFEHKLQSLNWDSKKQLWDLHFDVRKNGEKVDSKDVQARWVVLGTGYYDYEKALPTVIPGLESFKGRVVHPQFWPENLDLTDKKVAIIGSGATAITILPTIAKDAEQVTIVQRSPSYIASLPKTDRSAEILKRWLPLTWATKLLRIKYLVMGFLFFRFCQGFPKRARKMMYSETRKQLPGTIDVEPHFAPSYGPWDQRLCMCPDGDFYAALRSGRANIVTGHIDRVTEKGILIKDQPESNLDADVIVTATGLKILVGGGALVTINGHPVNVAEKMLWKGCMMQDIPNLIAVIGYTNASWTLGADVAAKTLTRMMGNLKSTQNSSATPTASKERDVQPVPFMKMNSTYLLKGRGSMPNAGNKYPWLPRASYFSDMWDAKFGDLAMDVVGLFPEPAVWRALY